MSPEPKQAQIIMRDCIWMAANDDEPTDLPLAIGAGASLPSRERFGWHAAFGHPKNPPKLDVLVKFLRQSD